MTLHPEVAKKAQAELDVVVGNDRLPTFADREQLPYLDALTKEVLRWNTVAPTGMRLLLYTLDPMSNFSQVCRIEQRRTTSMQAISSQRDRLSSLTFGQLTSRSL